MTLFGSKWRDDFYPITARHLGLSANQHSVFLVGREDRLRSSSLSLICWSLLTVDVSSVSQSGTAIGRDRSVVPPSKIVVSAMVHSHSGRQRVGMGLTM